MTFPIHPANPFDVVKQLTKIAVRAAHQKYHLHDNKEPLSPSLQSSIEKTSKLQSHIPSYIPPTR